ncbi:MAG: aspartate--tRNA(Asn) ligase [Candidatus Dormibacteraeota bacterium]|uniref:Aspartate--tRNA(Asp/Asn) ligase n=1 Tax=Candidatus Nephthysia bennettiae TaxID=3127016 RepID=A0A934KEI9_9BACT|nr:aspartate--tRNA(Asn) ligase [Candidatus Dormibacteraeota bacterium]MBJ7611021.1 aspartate--tRNA(Asn) ligase [Candidatus Dormibacteraeota bacterium]
MRGFETATGPLGRASAWLGRSKGLEVTEKVDRTWTVDLDSHVGESVLLRGWLHNFRRLSRVSFVILRDGRGLAQVVVDDPAVIEQLETTNRESVLEVRGTVAAEPQAPGGIEVREAQIEVLVPALEPPPVDLYRPVMNAQLPTILDHAPVTLRHPQRRLYFRLAHAAVAGFRSLLESRQFVEIQTPKLVGSATEGGANVFRVDYFGRPAYLAQSPQFYKQIMVGVYERVFEVGPVFRAEPHDTPRHINEYVSLDMEMGFIEDHTTVMAMLRDVIDAMLGEMGKRYSAELVAASIQLPAVPATIPAVHFTEAQRLISAATGEDLTGELDLAPSHETWLGEWALRDHGSEFLFVTGFPMVKRPFYTHPDPARPEYANGFDLLFRGLELVTGGQRLHRYEDYVAALQTRGMTSDGFQSYLEAFRYGMPPHGGFAIGLERLIARLVGARNIRETTLFPRDLNRLEP